MKSDTGKKFAGRVLTLITDNLTCADNWGFYIFDPVFDKEQELRNKIGAIWFSALYDSLDAQSRVLNEYTEIASRQEYKHILYWCDWTSKFFESAKALLNMFKKDEQLFVQNFRDGLVHGWLHKRHADEFYIKYVENMELLKVKIKNNDFHELIRPYYFTGNLDTNLSLIVLRFTDRKQEYWKYIYQLIDVKFSNKIATEIYSDVGIAY